MSELNCGCGCEETARYGRNCGCASGFGNNSCLWIILLLVFCGGCDFGCGSDRSGGCCNDSCMWIILLLIFCGGCGFGC